MTGIWNRLRVVPQHTSNIACVSQFVEIDDTALTGIVFVVPRML
jgi:myosin-crossreactive antigen